MVNGVEWEVFMFLFVYIIYIRYLSFCGFNRFVCGCLGKSGVIFILYNFIWGGGSVLNLIFKENACDRILLCDV